MHKKSLINNHHCPEIAISASPLSPLPEAESEAPICAEEKQGRAAMSSLAQFFSLCTWVFLQHKAPEVKGGAQLWGSPLPSGMNWLL